MEIKHIDDGKHGAFFILIDEKRVGEMVYNWSGTDRILITHTEVGPELAGHGAGKKMLFKAVDFAREKGIKIVPLCTYAASVFEKVDEIKDVL